MNATVSWKVPILALGPVTTVLLLPTSVQGFALPGETPLIMLVALALWSPMFFSIPALVLADARDGALPQYRGALGSFVRGLILVPYLMRRTSPVRVEMVASVIGFALAVVVALPLLNQVPALI